MRSSPLGRLLQFEGTAMLPNVLLMSKLMVLLLLAYHFFFKIEDPFIPFFQFLDVFNQAPGLFKWGLRILFGIFATTLFLNIWVRTSALILGAIVILGLVASKPLFNNHTFICGCALILAGLSNRTQPPLLLIYQLALVYLGASLNKFLDPDWWDGSFMHTWLFEARENPFYLTVSQWFPERYFAIFLSWIAMSSELILGVLFIFKRTRNIGVWIAIIFHTILFTMTAFKFGHFFQSLAILLIAFLNWPKGAVIVQFKSGSLKLLRLIFSWLDWDQKIKWEGNLSSNNWMVLKTKDGQQTNHKALKDLILYTPLFYISLLGLDMLLYLIFYYERTLLFILNLIIYWGLIFYFFPSLKNQPSK
ncbi:MAG: HTTM domain-containing protein [Bacteroidia bacterium]|nr:HTTM domain-containing protein [Bacteroidia bacterium]MBT8278555.1 HTTM domain-containing protein [Bacteroidia bacterium]